MNVKNTSPIVTVEGLVYPVNPIEVLGFSSPMSDEVIAVLVEQLTSRSNLVQLDLLKQLHDETKRARREEVSSRTKTMFFHENMEKLKSTSNQNTNRLAKIDFSNVGSFSEDEKDLIKKVAVWIRTKTLAEVQTDGLSSCIHQNEVITDADIEKSSLFARICNGKNPIVPIPPTAFGQPWYELLESELSFQVQVEESRSFLEKLLLNNQSNLIGEILLINKCEWKIDSVIEPGHKYLLKWPHTSLVYLLSRTNELLSSDIGTEAGWVLRKHITKEN
jgi:hypothetical protein